MNKIERPRSVFDLLAATIDLYREFPWLFLILAAAVVIPYEAIVLAATGAGPFAQGHLANGVSLLLTALDAFLITPLISALHVHAVDDVRRGETPTLGSVARRGLVTLPVVTAAAIISTLGIFAGLLALIVPGVLLLLRWAVVAQAAALDNDGWTEALRRSAKLTHDRYWHIIGVLILAGVITSVPFLAVGSAFSDTDTTAASFLVAIALRIVVSSFGALVTALLYFDLKARLQAASAQPVVAATQAPVEEPHRLDPDGYTDEDRPGGWYVDPEEPTRMRYWAAGTDGGWSGHTAKTPRGKLASWRKEHPPEDRGD